MRIALGRQVIQMLLVVLLLRIRLLIVLLVSHLLREWRQGLVAGNLGRPFHGPMHGVSLSWRDLVAS